MTTEELDSFLREHINLIGTVKITSDFIEYRDDVRSNFRKDSRDDTYRLIHADCLVLEHELLARGYVNEPTNKLHDFCLQNLSIDLKSITSKYFNLSEQASNKIPWWLKGIKNNLLTHFAFYKMNRPSRPLKENDMVSFEYIKAYDAMYVLNNLKRSRYDGYYFEV